MTPLQLGDDVEPRAYNLSLWTNPEKEHFTGLVSIELRLKRDLKSIILHAQDLSIRTVILRNDRAEFKGKFIPLKEGMATIEFDEVIAKGEYKLDINYDGNYQQDLMGLYRVKENDEFYIYTQFEPTSARKMLPCFDEPRFKAPFTLRVITGNKNKVIANAPLESVITQDDNAIHIFQVTKPISTYLLAVAVGPFDIVDGGEIKANSHRAEPFKFRGVTTKGKGDQLAFAMKETPAIVEALEAYFGMAYPFAKLDILAVPDFRSGAMENVGALTFRDWYLLLNEATASNDQKHDFYVVMAHELAHQWFGNAVTMPWWDDIWLNESFATWLSNKIVAQLRPEYQSQENFLEQIHAAMRADSLGAARKVHEPITTSHDIHNAFDAITYLKGGGLLSMLENYLGPLRFQQAVSAHIKKFNNRTATSRDFLQSLALFADESLIKSAQSFLNQAGVPVLKFAYKCTDSGFSMDVSQKRYMPLGAKLGATKWDIPACVAYEAAGKMQKHCFMLEKESTKIDIKSKTCPSFINPNAQGSGYYRFSMNFADWQSLLSAKNLSEADRLALADSLMSELRAGTLDFSFVAEALRQEMNVNAPMAASYFLSLMKTAEIYYVEESNAERLKSYARQAIIPLYKELKELPKLSVVQKELKDEILLFLANELKDTEAREELKNIGVSFLKQALAHEEHIQFEGDESLLGHSLALNLSEITDDEEFVRVMELFSLHTNAVTRNSLLTGLAHAREAIAADELRSFAFAENLRKNELMHFYYKHMANKRNQPATWHFLKNNYETFQKKVPESERGHLPYLAFGLCSEQEAREVEKFFSKDINNYPGGPRILREIVEGIDVCAATKKVVQPAANSFFTSMKGAEVASKP